MSRTAHKMSKVSLLFALLFLGGQKFVNSRRIAATLTFHKDDVLVINKYMPGKCETLDPSLRNKATYAIIGDKNIVMALYDQPMCGGKEIRLDTKTHGDLLKMDFRDMANSYKIFGGTELSSQQPDVILYSEMEYGGTSQAIVFGKNQCSNLPATFNTTNSIRVSKSVMLCKKKNCQGEKLEVDTDRESINDAYVSVKSVMLLPLPYTVTLFEDINYSGKQYNFTIESEGRCDDIPLEFVNKTSSLIISSDVKLYTQPRCKGLLLEVFFNLPDVGKLQHRVASIKKYSHSKAHITLYSGFGLWGQNYPINFTGDSSCVNLPDYFQNKTKSVKAHNNYMLCSEKDCHGIKKIVKATTGNITILAGKVMSVAQLSLPEPLILYEDKNYGGNQFNITFPRDTSCENLPDYFINKASSAVASKPVKLFTKKNCEGENMDFKYENDDLGKMDNKIRSVQKVVPAAILYQRTNFLSKATYITFPGNSKCETISYNFRNSVSSMILFENVTLYTGKNCKGYSHPMRSGVYPDIFELMSGINNNIESVGRPSNK